MSKVVPGIECAEVKQALSRTAGRIIPPARAHEIIRTAARRAAERVEGGDVARIDVEPPFKFEIELRSPVSDEVATMIGDHHPEFELRGDRTFAFEHDEMATAYRMAAIVGLLAQRGRVNHY
jgi:D-aminopeptidase